MRPILWCDDHVRMIDQTTLPVREDWLSFRTSDEVAEAIRTMKIRGAPAIGIAAAYGVALAALGAEGLEGDALRAELERATGVLAATRPTAVNLFWALERMRRAWAGGGDGAELRRRLVEEARALAAEDEDMCRAIGRHGATLVPDRARILTHCNAGALATGDYGTALGVVRAAHEAGKVDLVWVDETRPFLQGARLTAWELMQDGIPCRLICDNMAGHFMQRGQVDMVVGGADRITARMTEDGFGLWAVELSSDSRFIGFCGLSRPLFQSFFTPCVEIGWRLAHDVWGKGFATEAALAVLSLGFATYHLPEIVSFTSLTNERSQKVMRRIGMTRAGEFDHPNLPPGHRLCRHILYRISAEQHCAAENGSKIA